MRSRLAVALMIVVVAASPGASESAAAAGPGEYSPPEWLPIREPATVNCVFDNCPGPYHGYWAVDLLDPTNTPGDLIYPAGSGQVTIISSSSVCGGEGTPGNYLKVDHSNGVETYYYHFDEFMVADGAWVDVDTPLGTMGSTGYNDPCPTNHLHFELRRDGVRVDPIGLKACHGSEVVTYPREAGKASWNDMKGETIFSDGTDCAAGGSGSNTVDVDGDGAEDLIVSAPGENSGAGAVHVVYSFGADGIRRNSDGLMSDESVSQATTAADGDAEAGDEFGRATAVGDFDGDGFDDLAVGAPGENGDAGLVQVFYSFGTQGIRRTSDGAVDDESITQNTNEADGEAEPGDRFGQALTVGDFDADGFDDLAVGVPGENSASGAVQIFYSFGSAGLKNASAAVSDEAITQNSVDAAGDAEPGDRFGAALAVGTFKSNGRDDLAVGVPGENSASGAVQIFYSFGSAGLKNASAAVSDETVTQNSNGADGEPEAADQFGAALVVGTFKSNGRDDLAVGVPGENSSSGAVQVFYSFGTDGLARNSDGVVSDETVSQSTAGADGDPEPGDLFGRVVATGDFDDDGRDDLAIGVPGENSSSGAVQIVSSFGTDGLRRNTDGAVSDETISQNSAGADGAAEANDGFATSLAVGDYKSNGRHGLAIGVPGENAASGAGQIFHSFGAAGLKDSGASVSDETISQNTDGADGDAEPSDNFGA